MTSYRIGLPIALLLVAGITPATAGMAVKFFGTATGGDLSPDIEQAIADSGVDVHWVSGLIA